MTIKITTPNGGEDALEFGCSRTLNVAAVTATEISSGESKLELKTTTSGAIATKLTVTGAGNVGIGEAAPARRLEVTETSSSNFTGVRTNNPNTSTGQTGIEFQSDPTYCKAAIYQKRHAANGVGNLYFLVDTNADASNWEASDEKLRIQSDGQAIFSGTITAAALNTTGNVGIGTTPDSILHIQGANPNLIIQDTNDTGDAYIKFKNNTGTQRGYIQTAMTGDVMILGTGTTERMRITTTGVAVTGTLTTTTGATIFNHLSGTVYVNGGARALSTNYTNSSAYDKVIYVSVKNDSASALMMNVIDGHTLYGSVDKDAGAYYSDTIIWPAGKVIQIKMNGTPTLQRWVEFA